MHKASVYAEWFRSQYAHAPQLNALVQLRMITQHHDLSVRIKLVTGLVATPFSYGTESASTEIASEETMRIVRHVPCMFNLDAKSHPRGPGVSKCQRPELWISVLVPTRDFA